MYWLVKRSHGSLWGAIENTLNFVMDPITFLSHSIKHEYFLKPAIKKHRRASRIADKRVREKLMDDLKIVTGKKKESVVDNASGFAFRHEYHISKGSTKGNKTVQDRMKLLLDAANDDATALAKLRKGGVDESLINKLKKATTTKNKFDILQKDTVISHFKEIMTSSTAREIRSRSMKTAQDYSPAEVITRKDYKNRLIEQYKSFEDGYKTRLIGDAVYQNARNRFLRALTGEIHQFVKIMNTPDEYGQDAVVQATNAKDARDQLIPMHPYLKKRLRGPSYSCVAQRKAAK